MKLCRSVEEVEAAARAIIGMQLVTKQTGPQAERFTKCLSARESILNGNCILRLCSTVPRDVLPSCFALRRHGYRAVAEETPEKILLSASTAGIISGRFRPAPSSLAAG